MKPQTLLEIEAGKRVLRDIRNQDAMRILQQLGVENVTQMDETTLMINLEFAKHSGEVNKHG